MTNLQIELKEKISEKNNILKAWSQDVATLANKKNFDPSSPKGQKKLNKIADKYAKDLVDIEDEIEELEQKRPKAE